MENSTEEQREGGGANTEINEEEAELKEEKTHNNLKGTHLKELHTKAHSTMKKYCSKLCLSSRQARLTE